MFQQHRMLHCVSYDIAESNFYRDLIASCLGSSAMFSAVCRTGGEAASNG